MKNSIAKITIPEFKECGTCYFLSKNVVATCFHVIESVFNVADNTLKPDSCQIKFYQTFVDEKDDYAEKIRIHKTTVKTLLDVDQKNDIAILELTEAMHDAEPVILLRHNTVPENADWDSRGFPVINENGIPLSGKIKSLAILDVNDQQRLELQEGKILDKPLGGISGSPVFVDGKVVGHITSNAVGEDGSNLLGLIYAVSGLYIRRLADKFVAGLGDELGMVVFENGEIYVKRGIEVLISDDLLKGGVSLTGYQMSGKTRTIDYFEKFEKNGIFLNVLPQNIRRVSFDFNKLKTLKERNIESLLEYFCDIIIKQLKKTGDKFNPPDWSEPDDTKAFIASEWFVDEPLKYFKENNLKFFIYIDNGEMIFDHFDPTTCDNFFSVLRGWTADEENKGIFGVLISFTDAFFLRNLKRPAAFNGRITHELMDYNEEDIQTFARKYCLEHRISDENLKPEQVEEIIKWTGGNPCMVWLLFVGIEREKASKREKFDFDKAFKKIIENRNYFTHYLEPLENSLRDEQSKELALYEINYSYPNKKESKPDIRRSLVKSGILLEQPNDDGRNKRYKLRCAHFNFV